VIHMPLPDVPMAPITSSNIPEGPEWGYQIKWDGVRTARALGRPRRCGVVLPAKGAANLGLPVAPSPQAAKFR
jgi:hypothetical protein